MPPKRTVEYNGKTYKSYRSLCAEFHVDYGTFHARFVRGLPMSECLLPADRSVRFAVVVNGVRYASRKAACVENGASISTVNTRMARLNLSFEDALRWEKPGTTVEDKCSKHGVHRWTYWSRLRRGWTDDQALGVAPPPIVPAVEPSAVRLKFQYGITITEYENMIASRGGCCWICGGDMNPPCVDHDHKTGRVRGILCRPCNTAIGFMKDDPTRLRSAASYLEAT